MRLTFPTKLVNPFTSFLTNIRQPFPPVVRTQVIPNHMDIDTGYELTYITETVHPTFETS